MSLDGVGSAAIQHIEVVVSSRRVGLANFAGGYAANDVVTYQLKG